MPKLVLVGGLSRNSFCKSLVGLESCFFPSGPKLVLVSGLLRNRLDESLVARRSGFLSRDKNVFWVGGSAEGAALACAGEVKSRLNGWRILMGTVGVVCFVVGWRVKGS